MTLRPLTLPMCQTSISVNSLLRSDGRTAKRRSRRRMMSMTLRRRMRRRMSKLILGVSLRLSMIVSGSEFACHDSSHNLWQFWSTRHVFIYHRESSSSTIFRPRLPHQHTAGCGGASCESLQPGSLSLSHLALTLSSAPAVVAFRTRGRYMAYHQ